ncbi:MAG: proton-conducting transporter membrane subunit [Caldilineaceae bacterium]
MISLNPNILAAPIAIPLITAALGLPFVRWGWNRAAQWQRRLAAIGVIADLAVAVTLLVYTLEGNRLVMEMGDWPAPFGIVLVADGLTAIMLTLSGILTATTVFYAMGSLDSRARMNYFPLLMFLLMGVNGAFLAGDLFNLYVFFEVLLMASFALLTLGGQIGQINGGIRYVLLNLLASSFFLAAAGLTYGTIGTLNMAHIAERMPTAPYSIQIFIAGLLLIAFSSKAGLFPVFFWLPSSYHTPHPSVTALFGGLLTKVGIYTLFRIYPLIFPHLLQEWQPLILAIAGLTMLTGVFGAMAVNTIRRVLSFHVISQVGYMVMGLGLAASRDPKLAVFGMSAGILYLVHHMIVKTSLLMAGGAAELEVGSGSLLRQQLTGLNKRRPALAVLFFIAAMSLAGVPPSSGFVSKLSLLQGAVTGNFWLIAAVSLLVSMLTLMSMLRLWQKAFFGAPTQPLSVNAPMLSAGRRRSILWSITVLVVLSLSIGIFAGPVFRMASIAGAQVMDREGYIAAVHPTDQIIYAGVEHGD